MSVAPILRIAGVTDLGLRVAECTGWFGHALPLTGSPEGEITFVLGTAFLLHELGDQTACLRAWLAAAWRRWWDHMTGGGQ